MSSLVRNSFIRTKYIKIPTKDNTISITVCVNFADKLRVSLESNSQFLKKLYIVTDPNDKETIDLCKGFSNVELIFCSDAFKNGAKFNKSCLLKTAQSKIHPNHRDDWIIIIDADTLLPTNFWTESIYLQSNYLENTVYLMKRKIYKSAENYKNGTHSEIQHGCGFFQMYYSKNKMYGDFSENASVCDILFQQLFINQTELHGFCIHLGQNGMDWDGRVSQNWSADISDPPVSR